jgi:hypothetical protein
MRRFWSMAMSLGLALALAGSSQADMRLPVKHLSPPATRHLRPAPVMVGDGKAYSFAFSQQIMREAHVPSNHKKHEYPRPHKPGYWPPPPYGPPEPGWGR